MAKEIKINNFKILKYYLSLFFLLKSIIRPTSVLIPPFPTPRYEIGKLVPLTFF